MSEPEPGAILPPAPSPTGVLYVTATGGYGGPVASLVTVLGRLDGMHRVVCAPRAAKAAYWDRLRSVSDELVPITRPRGTGIAIAQRQVLATARRHRRSIEVIHANSLTELVVALPAAIALDLPIVVWVHNWEVPAVSRLARPLIRSRGDRIRFAGVSTFTRDLVVSAGLITAERFEIIPNPIDPAVVGDRNPGENDRLCIGFLGRSERRKGFDLLPACIEALRDAPVRWAIFSTPFAGEREAWRRVLATPPQLVSVSPLVADVSRAYARCDLVFVPSRMESFCRVAAEALLNGLPVVASDLVPLREVLAEGTAGVLFPAGDADAAADALRALVADPRRRDALGRAGRERAEAFLPGAVSRSLVRLYRDAAEQATASVTQPRR
ncbi:glycosyltransferase family 4 protein [Rhabdothermincola sediminis]|uniref:glycosyltransferase family 4 protein n=1 Tax=Rhabdothermincola sediminis TaxID=2751370 RepID=UPI001AA08B7E|nr:glycosyltransferase family 4 protein [Rhabdothermincola sediminis]